MECFTCKGLPDFYCESQETFICLEHIAGYLGPKKSQNIAYFNLVLQDVEFDSLKKGIKSLIQGLIASKESITVHLLNLQEEINSLHIESLRKIEKMIKFYQSLTRQNRFPENYSKKIKAIQSLQITKFEMRHLNFNENYIQNIREYFICAECREVIIHRRFECGHEGCFNCLEDHDVEKCLGGQEFIVRCLDVPQLRLEESEYVRDEVLVGQNEKPETYLKSEEYSNIYQAKCKDCGSTEDVYKTDENYISCYNCYYKISQCHNCNRMGSSCQLRCDHNGCNICYNENICRLCQSILINDSSNKICDKCFDADCQGCNKVKFLFSETKDFDIQNNEKLFINEYQKEKNCSNCGKFGAIFIFDCKHLGCVSCCNDNLCRSCSHPTRLSFYFRKRMRSASDFNQSVPSVNQNYENQNPPNLVKRILSSFI